MPASSNFGYLGLAAIIVAAGLQGSPVLAQTSSPVLPYGGRLAIPSDAITSERLALAAVALNPAILDDDDFYANLAVKYLCDDALRSFGGEFQASGTFADFRAATRSKLAASMRGTRRSFQMKSGGRLETYDVANQRFPVSAGFWSKSYRQPTNVVTIEGRNDTAPTCPQTFRRPDLPKPSGSYARFWRIELDRPVDQFPFPIEAARAEALVAAADRGVDIELDLEITGARRAEGVGYGRSITLTGRVLKVRVFSTRLRQMKYGDQRPLFEIPS